jgi:hypothetical protein
MPLHNGQAIEGPVENGKPSIEPEKTSVWQGDLGSVVLLNDRRLLHVVKNDSDRWRFVSGQVQCAHSLPYF